MKIVVVSLTYLPAVGGLENIMGGLAFEWSKEHEIIVFTNNRDQSKDDTYPYTIFRVFNIFQLYKAVKKADIFIEANISLNTFWVGLLIRKKWFVVHHGLYNTDYKGWIKKQITRFSNNITVSNFLAKDIKGISFTIANFYYPDFKIYSGLQRNKDIAFVGRVVSDKGIDLLIEALVLLNFKGHFLNLTVIGKGAELMNLKQKVINIGLEKQVNFLGVKKGDELAELLNEHKVLVVPSKVLEGFGIVALEGLACGCKVVVPDAGGLQEAVGEFGFVFKHNNVESLAEIIQIAIEADSFNLKLVEAHLAKHQASFVAQQYIQLFNKKRSTY